MCIFCFPVTVWQSERIDDFTIWSDASVTVLDPCIRGDGMCLFTEQCEVGLVAIMLEKVLECDTDDAFVFFTELRVFFQFNVVGVDRFMRGLDIELRHLFSPCIVGIRAIPTIHGVRQNYEENFAMKVSKPLSELPV